LQPKNIEGTAAPCSPYRHLRLWIPASRAYVKNEDTFSSQNVNVGAAEALDKFWGFITKIMHF